jgi:Fe-S-cluster-containing dehydrogenase component
MSEKELEGITTVSEESGLQEEAPTTSRPLSRRQLLKIAGLSGIGAVGLCVVGAAPWEEGANAQGTATPAAKAERQTYVPKAKGLVIAIPARCTGCRRCELACVDYNEGKSQPSMSRIRIARNLNFGVTPTRANNSRGQGIWGDQMIVQDTCKQCPHPVPCMLACPHSAIELDPTTNARIVNQDKCVGCRICQEACPWEMMTFDEDKKKATKCHLCGGDPACVKACPTGALQYIPWQDMTKSVPQRRVVPAYITLPADAQETCAKCH